MPTVEQQGMLDTDDLREIDETLLDYLNEGRVTPAYCRKRMLSDGDRENISRGYVQERLARFVEHDQAQNLFETGLYELIEDPRNE